jgi:hypothetical protein
MNPAEIASILRPFLENLTEPEVKKLHTWLAAHCAAHPALSKLVRVTGAIQYDGEITDQEFQDLRTRIEQAVAILESPKSSSGKDEHGQPAPIPAKNWIRNIGKGFDQLSGICLGILADGKVTDEEAVAFRKWANEFAAVNQGWPFDVIVDRVEAVFADKVVTDEEREDLAAIMREIIGQDCDSPIERDRSTHLPFDDSDLEIEFDGREFIPTGRFAFGSRRKIEALIVSHGGVFQDKMPTLSTSYLVVGEFVSRDWISTQYGRKIERAIELRDKHGCPAIVCEKHFLSSCGLGG